MEANIALETAKAIHEAGMTVTVELVAELQMVTHDEAHTALEGLVAEGRLYSTQPRAGAVATGELNYSLTAYIPLVA
jgi:competence protein ComGC